MTRILAATLLASPALLLAAPAAAQSEAGDKVNMVIAYDESECPEMAEDNEIVVCQILVEADRYRVPAALRTSNSPQNTAWTERVESIRYVGEFGTMSCSPVGAGGFTGCTQQLIDAAYKDRSEASNVRFAQLIEQARAERLSTIDEDAAIEQERVEQIEREYLERLERERAQPLPGEVGETDLPEIGPETGSEVGPTIGPEAPAEEPSAEAPE